MATVLVVEDDKLSQRILNKILSGNGHTALLTASIEEAWAALRQQVWVDLVILDNQLGRNWGWRFLEELRQDVLYRDLPVVIYTGHTERSSILRYVELGVTSMLVKPYKAEVIYDEVAKAVKADWAGKLIERPAAACERLKIKEPDYYSMLSAGATALEKILSEIRRAIVGRNGAPPISEVLQQIYNQSLTLGMPALRSTTEVLAKAIANHNQKVIENCLQSIDSLRALLRHRALAYVGIGEVTTPAQKSQPSVRPTAPPLDPEELASSAAQVFRRQIASVPLIKLGASFGRLTGNRFFSEGELPALTTKLLKQRPFADFLAAAHFIDYATSVSMEELESGIKALPGFEKTFLDIASRLSAKTDTATPEAELGLAIKRLGMDKTIVLSAAARLAPTLRVTSPLDLEPLRTHTLCTALLSYEIARMFRLDNEPVVASAGLLHNIGTWVFALAEPGLYGAALAIAEGSNRLIDDAERDVFGYSHREVGSNLLAQADRPAMLQVTAEYYSQPQLETNRQFRPVVATVHLASELAWTIAAQQERLTTQFQARLLASNNPVWDMLEESGVTLPMDLPELLDVLLTAAKTCSWITTLLMELGSAPESFAVGLRR